MKYLLSLIVFLNIAHFGFAQDKAPLVTDRPDQTEAPILVPRGALQVETGFQIENDRANGIKDREITYNTTLVKYGVNENLELRVINEYLGTDIGIGSEEKKFSGFSPLALGVKIKMSEAKGIWPDAALIGHINLATGTNEYQPDNTAADFRFTFSNKLTDKLALSYNVGAEWDGEIPGATFLYTLSLAYGFSERLGGFIEGYSFFPERSKADNRVDAGLTFLITPVVQWDVSAGLGLSKISPDSFISTGFSFRVFK
jgi:hypothetical protein